MKYVQLGKGRRRVTFVIMTFVFQSTCWKPTFCKVVGHHLLMGNREKIISFSFASVHGPCFCFNKLPLSWHVRFFPILFSPCPVLLRRGVMEQVGEHMASSQRQPWQLLAHASGRSEIVQVMHLLKVADRQDLFASKWCNSYSFSWTAFWYY